MRVSTSNGIAALHSPATSVEALEHKIVRDFSLSFNLFKRMNSPFFGVPREVDSVRRAVVLLGCDEIRKLLARKAGVLGEALNCALAIAQARWS